GMGRGAGGGGREQGRVAWVAKVHWGLPPDRGTRAFLAAARPAAPPFGTYTSAAETSRPGSTRGRSIDGATTLVVATDAARRPGRRLWGAGRGRGAGGRRARRAAGAAGRPHQRVAGGPARQVARRAGGDGRRVGRPRPPARAGPARAAPDLRAAARGPLPAGRPGAARGALRARGRLQPAALRRRGDEGLGTGPTPGTLRRRRGGAAAGRTGRRRGRPQARRLPLRPQLPRGVDPAGRADAARGS